MVKIIEGNSINSMHNHYHNARNAIFTKIESTEKEEILNSDAKTLTEFFVQDYLLPIIQIDEGKKPIVEDETKTNSQQMQLKVGLPLILEEKVDTVIGLSSSTQLIGMRFSLDDGCLVSRININTQNPDEMIKNELNKLKQVVSYKNQDIPTLNKRLREETNRKIIQLQTKLIDNKKRLDSIKENISFELIKKNSNDINSDLEIKEKHETIDMNKKNNLESEPKIVRTRITPATKPESSISNKQWDVFISHASEDKETVAKPFAEKLRSMDLDVWYDEFSLKWGKSLRKSIDEGLSNSLFGIVILSKVFFQKTWTKLELDALISIMTSTGHDNVLPLRYEISHDEVARVSPILAGIFSRSWDEGIEKLSNEVKELVEERKINQK